MYADIVKFLIDAQMEYYLQKSFRLKGLEKTIEIIKDVYQSNPTIKELYLKKIQEKFLKK